jgi:hypothetical protein
LPIGFRRGLVRAIAPSGQALACMRAGRRGSFLDQFALVVFPLDRVRWRRTTCVPVRRRADPSVAIYAGARVMMMLHPASSQMPGAPRIIRPGIADRDTAPIARGFHDYAIRAHDAQALDHSRSGDPGVTLNPAQLDPLCR